MSKINKQIKKKKSRSQSEKENVRPLNTEKEKGAGMDQILLNNHEQAIVQLKDNIV